MRHFKEVKKLKVKMTIAIKNNYAQNEDSIEMTFEDEKSNVHFLVVKLNSRDFMSALGRLSNINVDGEVYGLEKVGLVHEHKSFEFAMPPEANNMYGERREQLALSTVKKVCPEGWEPDGYFGAQNSFFCPDGVNLFARCTIRRWR